MNCWGLFIGMVVGVCGGAFLRGVLDALGFDRWIADRRFAARLNRHINLAEAVHHWDGHGCSVSYDFGTREAVERHNGTDVAIAHHEAGADRSRWKPGRERRRD